MKWIKYNFLAAEINHGTEEKPDIKQILMEKSLEWNEVNEEIAKREAHNGEYEIIDDGQEEPEQQPTAEDIINAMLGVNK